MIENSEIVGNPNPLFIAQFLVDSKWRERERDTHTHTHTHTQDKSLCVNCRVTPEEHGITHCKNSY
jgi:hypothetical protein